MKIAVQGCMHGDLDTVYKTLQHIEKTHNTKIDLLLCCGDFQAVRNEHDLDSLNAPLHYRHMNSFWKYYSGQAIAPYPTIFIGGNHEASNYLWELYYGGWAAPNIYFLGFAGIVKFGNLRIGGLSGIYKSHDYHSGHYERPPYNKATIKSVYHVREYDVHKLMQVEEPIDIFLSHDWPVGVTDCGDWKQLVRDKPYFEKEVRKRKLGSQAAALLLQKLKPTYWFSAHLHCKFAARVRHGVNGPVTNFLALDKCGRGREFLQVLDIESEPGPYEIQYDEEWLEITRRFNSVFPLTTARADLKNVHLDKEVCREWVRRKLQARGARPFEFSQTAPSFNPSNKRARPFEFSQTAASYNPFNKRDRPFELSQTAASYNPSLKSDDSDGCFPECTRNPQTESLLEFLELPYLLDNISESLEVSRSPFPSGDTYNSEEIPIDDVDDELEDLADEEAWEDSLGILG